MLEIIVRSLAIHCHLERGTPCSYSPFLCLSTYPVVTAHPFPCTLLLLNTSPISVHPVVTVHFPYLCTPCCYCPSLSVHPVVTEHFPLSLYTLLLQHTSLQALLSQPSMSLTLHFAQTRSIRHTCLHFTLLFPKHKTHPTVQFRRLLLVLSCFNISTARNVVTINISTVDVTTVTLGHHFEVRCSFVYMRSEEFGRVRQLSVLCHNMEVGDEMQGAMEEEPNGMDVLVFIVVTQAPRHETIRSSAGAPAYFYNVGLIWTFIVASRPDRFIPGQKAFASHQIGHRVGPTAGLDVSDDASHFLPRESNCD
jgi:hypothetical protein